MTKIIVMLKHKRTKINNEQSKRLNRGSIHYKKTRSQIYKKEIIREIRERGTKRELIKCRDAI